MALIYNATFDSQTRVLSLLDKAGNVISSCEVPSKSKVDDITKPLTLKATQNGSTVALTKKGSPTGSFQTSRDGGNTWADYTLDTAITLNTGDEVSFRAKTDRTSAQDYQNYFYFMMEGKIEAWHNVMSMIRTRDFATYKSVVDYAFGYLFNGCTSLTKAPVLPATTLADGCYFGMFRDCQSLTKAPVLPVTTLAQNCYNSMFYGCTSLTNATELPATTLVERCYNCMFQNCTSLVNAPELPATTLAQYCYFNMFSGCQSLIKAPELPATTLAQYCYSSMFVGCTSLVNAPALPATTLAQYCYMHMFNGCTSLVNAPALPATTLASSCYYGLFKGCTSLVNAPVLPATTLASNCYMHMFNGCTSLVNAPVLPATTLANGCYSNMFDGCTSLVNAPVLPATTLAVYCYGDMFVGCTSLVKAPELPATTLGERCYVGMYKGCSSLNEVRCKMPSTISTENIPKYTAHGFSGTSPWLSGVSSTGTFYTNADANWTSGVSGIPEGWTRVNEIAKDDITKPLTLTATADNSSVKIWVSDVVSNKYEVDTGNGWEDYAFNTVIPLNAGQSCKWRCKSHPTTQTDSRYIRFVMTGTIEASGNCNSLLSSDFENLTSLSRYNYAFISLFKGCKSLTKAPALPATVLSPYCYFAMYEGCQSLKEVRISATTKAEYALQRWLSGVSATGDFYCDPNATIFPTDSASGIPQNWVRHALADYPVTP